jgi:hypothetical protein
VRAAIFGLFGFLEDAAEEWRTEAIGDREKLENMIMAVILAGLATTAAE